VEKKDEQQSEPKAKSVEELDVRQQDHIKRELTDGKISEGKQVKKWSNNVSITKPAKPVKKRSMSPQLEDSARKYKKGNPSPNWKRKNSHPKS